MVWSILLLLNNTNGWFINYIEKKLKSQIYKLHLQNKIEVIIFKPNIKFVGDYVNIIENETDISDNYVETIFNKIVNTKVDCIGLSGLIFIDNEPHMFSNDDRYRHLKMPITKSNPIKKEIIFNLQNIIYYINSKNLSKYINTIDNVDEIIVFKKTTSKKESVSIIITAYNSEKYIEECLDSIENQTYFINNDNFEVLVGVDACQKTLDKVNQIKYKYRNLQIYMMESNRGTYVTTNTLLNLVKNENVIRFDSDDVMSKSLVYEVIENKKDKDIIILGSLEMQNGKINNKFLLTEGTIYFKKSFMDNVAGGYQPWVCSADTELIKRVVNKAKITQLKKALFYRRIHSDSLTQNKSTAYKSEVREKYKKQIKPRYNDNEIKISRVVNNFIDKNKIKEKKNISIFITAYNSQEYIEDCLNSIENQLYFINNNKFEVLVGVDGCEKTLMKLKKIKHKYRNLRIFMMDSNMGTYVTSNTLLDLVKYKNIIRFDSDDVMKLDMIEKISVYIDHYDIIKFGYNIFYDNICNIENNKFHFPHGVVLYKKYIFDRFGGYQNWLCAADTELLVRVKNYVKIKEINDRLFLRRQHDDSLTKKVDTKHGSGLRQTYKSMIGKHKSEWIDKKTNTYVEY